MLITKFNKMIRNKWVWAVFAALISVGFVGGSFLSRIGQDPNQRREGVEGTLDGEDVSSKSFYQSRFFELGMKDRGQSDDEYKVVRERTWRRIAALRSARGMGLMASDAEVSERITRDEAFWVNGAFNSDVYKRILYNQLQVPVSVFESYLREEMTIQKLVDVMASATWTSPNEMADKISNLTDEFIVEYGVLETEKIVAKIDVSNDDASTFFDENQELFRIPDKVSVKYVALAISNYLDVGSVTETNVIEYYDSHASEYTVSTTNDEVEAVPLDDVRDEIVALLAQQAAMYKAKDAATDFVVAMIPDRSSKKRDIETVAARLGLTVRVSGFFPESDMRPLPDAGPDFSRAAFGLDVEDPARHFSDAVVGSENVYVLSADERQGTRIPVFDEVSDIVMPIVRRRMEDEAFRKSAEEVRAAIVNSVADGESFTDAMAKYDVEVATSGVFTVYSGPAEESTYLDALTYALPSLRTGDISEPLEVQDGAVLAFVVSRRAGDPSSIQLLRPQLVSALDRYRAAILFHDWSESLLVQAEFVDLAARPTVEE